jgi:hypothetical protein
VLIAAIENGTFKIPLLPLGLLSVDNLAPLTEFFQKKLDANEGILRMPALRAQVAGGAGAGGGSGAGHEDKTNGEGSFEQLAKMLLLRQMQQPQAAAQQTQQQWQQRMQQQMQQQQQQWQQQQWQQQQMMMVTMQGRQVSPIPARAAVPTPTPADVDFIMKHAFNGSAYAAFDGISVAQGAAVTLISETQGGWAKVRTADGRVGMVPRNRLEASPKPPMPELPPPPELPLGEGGGGGVPAQPLPT